MKSEASWAVYVNGSLVVPGDCLIDRWGRGWVYGYISRTPNSHGQADLMVYNDAFGEREFTTRTGVDVFVGAVVKRLEATEEEYILRLLETPRTFGEAVL